MEWIDAPDIKKSIKIILQNLDYQHINPDDLFCMRSSGSSSRAIARIWSLPRVWREVLKLRPQYIIEVVSERFDRLSEDQKQRTLIHELMHIPKNFSGSLVSHRGRYHRIDGRSVDKLFRIFLANKDYLKK
ncbi:metallopeptidase [Candidatus Gottesmanbacteria bacterium]|nr:metallopeptidase [Candidatus Gottesmanbacteria bacterium]